MTSSTLHVIRVTHLAIGLLVVQLVHCLYIAVCCGSFCHVMWVRKQEAEAEWQEFAAPTAALRHIKAEGGPSTLQEVQIERAAKNSKPRNGFEFSYKTPPPPLRHNNPHTPKPPPLPLRRYPSAALSKFWVRRIAVSAAANYVG